MARCSGKVDLRFSISNKSGALTKKGFQIRASDKRANQNYQFENQPEASSSGPNWSQFSETMLPV